MKARNKRRGHKPVLPSFVIGNLRSINNKTDELHAYVTSDRTVNTASVMCFTETWLNDKISDNCVDMPGFKILRGDRNCAKVGKDGGGGVCSYINEKWCHPKNSSIKFSSCSDNVEILTINIRPYYLPREFSQVFVTTVYVNNKANKEAAASEIVNHILDLENSAPDALKIINGDFNRCSLESNLPNFQQQIHFTTRTDPATENTSQLDLFYCNTKDSYKCIKLPPLGHSDHNMISLIPRYRARVCREPVTTKSIQRWTSDARDTLIGCMEATDWSVFTESETNLDTIVDTVTSYISWCVDCIVSTKQVKVFPNGKPWINKQIKNLLKDKKKACNDNDTILMKSIQKSIDKEIKNAKKVYKNKIEQNFKDNNMKKVWDGMNIMSGRKNVNHPSVLCTSNTYANELNEFYARFDCNDFSEEIHNIRNKLMNCTDHDDYVIDEIDVLKTLKKINPTKAKGPDGLSPRILKICAEQFANIFTYIFNLSILNCYIPQIWKMSCIIPVPKKPNVKVMNDYRPVALTPCIMKVFERIFITHLQSITSKFIDPNQFAYRKNRSVDDALLCMLNSTYSHLEKAKSSVRIMFFDFSSAFNTIQPHILVKKLINMNISPNISLWILEYLTNRPQYVKIKCPVSDTSKNTQVVYISDTVFTNTGCPQGTVLSPYLFSLYTSDSRINSDMCSLIKYADDTALTGLILDDQCSHYLSSVDSFVDWCDQNYLQLNVTKTKEMVIDFRKTKTIPDPVILRGENVERVTSYKYLGTTVDQSLSWNENTQIIIKKANSRLYCLRKLHTFNVNRNILQLFFSSVLCSVLTFGVVSWGGNITQGDRNKIERLIRKGGRVVGGGITETMTDMYDRRLYSKVNQILNDDTHPLRGNFDSLIIERSGRLRTPKAKTVRYQKSFLCKAVGVFNDNYRR